MTDYTRLLNELGDLRREVLDATREARGAQLAVASIMRRGRIQLIAKEHDDGWRRLAPDVGLVQWDPRRANEPVAPDLSGSLVSRLRRGDPVSDQLGNTAAVGLVNVLTNPLLEGMDDISPNTTGVRWGMGWTGRYLLNSGTAPSGTVIGVQANRFNVGQHPFNSAMCYMSFSATASTDVTMWAISDQWLPSFDTTAPPFLAASAQLSRFSGANHANLTRLDAWVEIVRDTTVVASSPVYDIKNSPFVNSFASVRATAVVAEPVAGWSTYGWSVRVMVRAAYSGTTAGYRDHLYFAEPQLTLSTSQSAPPFGPLVGNWQPQGFATYYANGTQPVLTIGSISGLTQSLVWGPGGTSALDTGLARSAAATLRILNPYGGTDPEALELGTSIRISRVSTGRVSIDSRSASAATELAIVSTSGQRAKIEARVSGDSESRFALWGDATMQGLEFGPGNAANDTNLYRSAADTLKTDDKLLVGSGTPTNIRGVISQTFAFSGTLAGSGTQDMYFGDQAANIQVMRSPFKMEVVGISISSTQSRAGGTLTAQVYNSSTAGLVGPSAALDGTTTNDKTVTDTVTGTADVDAAALYRMRLTTSGYSPTTSQSIVVTLYLALYAE